MSFRHHNPGSNSLMMHRIHHRVWIVQTLIPLCSRGACDVVQLSYYGYVA
jgi:hypothetical protein